jgi:hypothetical protein
MLRLTPLHAPGMRKTLSGSSDERTPIAGPSRLSAFDLGSHTANGGGGRDTVASMFSGHRDYDAGFDTDEASTPRLGLAQSLTRDTSSFDLTPVAPPPVPASERLRAVLARTRNQSEPVTAMTARGAGRGAGTAMVPPSPGGPEYDVSDLDAQSMSGAAGPSFAQESLKDLFGRFTLHGDTPVKGKGHTRRRSSLERVQGESPGVRVGAVRRAKRVSLSDDELHSGCYPSYFWNIYGWIWTNVIFRRIGGDIIPCTSFSG